MNEEKVIVLRLRFTRTRALLALVLLFLCWHPRPLDSETLTLTTYYPAPYGGYVSILTTGNTYLSRDSGYVSVGTPPASPVAGIKLDINGNAWTRGQMQWGTAGSAALIADQNGSIRLGSGGSPYIDFGSSRLWQPGASQLQVIGDLSVTGNINGISPNRIMGYCSEVGFGGGTSWCPPNTRVMAQYGTGRSYAGLLFLGNSALEAGSGWVPHYDQGTSGTMLCCRIQ